MNQQRPLQSETTATVNRKGQSTQRCPRFNRIPSGELARFCPSRIGWTCCGLTCRRGPDFRPKSGGHGDLITEVRQGDDGAE